MKKMLYVAQREFLATVGTKAFIFGILVTPLVIGPGESLCRALTMLDAGEEWLLEPRQIAGVPHAWTPGIRLGVRPGSWFHQTECFGPVLGIMRADSLAQATEWQNATAYGLTAGLHSLDAGEIAWWKEHVEAGNLYINRAITGAIVRRQPFGGWKRSCIGQGAKAGGHRPGRHGHGWFLSWVPPCTASPPGGSAAPRTVWV
jgi:RHH-type proline utilization regulon transcriptional repressor/proline dehydrogenase/delta 1-pyrroline-5-carboxylate dehydrogenase